MDKENYVPATPTRPAPRKSYSILSPSTAINIRERTEKFERMAAKERQISESTGLVKFALSPKKNTNGARRSPVKTPARPPRPITTPSTVSTTISPVTPGSGAIPLESDTEADLIDQYTQRQRELIHHEKEVERIKFELVSISTRMETCKRNQCLKDNHVDYIKQAHDETTSQLEKLKLDQPITITGIKKKASTIFAPPTTSELEKEFTNLKKKASSLFTNDLTRKASTMFDNNTFFQSNNSTNFFQSNNNNNNSNNFFQSTNKQIDEMATKTSMFFTDVILTLSPKKESAPQEDVHLDTSFNIDHLSELHPLPDMKVIYEHSDSEAVDIDDYDSSFE